MSNLLLDNQTQTLMEPAESPALTQAKAMLLINVILRQQQPQFAEATKLVPNLKVLVSADKEPQRDYRPDFSAIDVTIQKTLTLRRKWKHGAGFTDDLYLHIPYDTLAQLRRYRPDVILSYELGFRSLASCVYRKLHRNCGLVIAVKESEQTVAAWGGVRKMVRRFILKSADVVTYNGDSGRRYLTQQMHVPESKLRLITYVAHPDMVYAGSTDRVPEIRHKLIYVGQMTERKNILPFMKTLIRWCKDHPQRTIEMSLAGRGPLDSELRALSLPVNLKCTFLGSVDPSQLPELYSQHGLMVFPTLADEWGLVTNEAMHSGLPLLASVYAQSTLVVVKDGVHGWHYRSDEEESTYDGISRMFSADVNLLNTMAAAGRAAIAERTPAWGGRLVAEAIVAGLRKK